MISMSTKKVQLQLNVCTAHMERRSTQHSLFSFSSTARVNVLISSFPQFCGNCLPKTLPAFFSRTPKWKIRPYGRYFGAQGQTEPSQPSPPLYNILLLRLLRQNSLFFSSPLYLSPVRIPKLFF